MARKRENGRIRIRNAIPPIFLGAISPRKGGQAIKYGAGALKKAAPIKGFPFRTDSRKRVTIRQTGKSKGAKKGEMERFPNWEMAAWIGLSLFRERFWGIQRLKGKGRQKGRGSDFKTPFPSGEAFPAFETGNGQRKRAGIENGANRCDQTFCFRRDGPVTRPPTVFYLNVTPRPLTGRAPGV